MVTQSPNCDGEGKGARSMKSKTHAGISQSGRSKSALQSSPTTEVNPLDRNGHTIAKLRWRGQRRAVYEVEDTRWDITVGALEKRIAIISDDGSESFLIERSRANPNKPRLRVEMAEGDNFCLMRSWKSRRRATASLAVHKEFYSSTLLVFHFN